MKRLDAAAYCCPFSASSTERGEGLLIGSIVHVTVVHVTVVHVTLPDDSPADRPASAGLTISAGRTGPLLPPMRHKSSLVKAVDAPMRDTTVPPCSGPNEGTSAMGGDGG